LERIAHSFLAIKQGGFAQTLRFNMKKSSESGSESEAEKHARVPLDDAPFAIVVLAVTSFTLIIFVLTITLLMS